MSTIYNDKYIKIRNLQLEYGVEKNTGIVYSRVKQLNIFLFGIV